MADGASITLSAVGARLGRVRAAAEVVEGPNLYRIVRNQPAGLIDSWGLACGSGSTEPVTPDSPFGFDFSGACANHDACYDSCGTPKDQCDRKFLNDMKNKCKSYQPALANPAFCELLAYVYYEAVNLMGGTAYNNAQVVACPCVSAAKSGGPVLVPPHTTVLWH